MKKNVLKIKTKKGLLTVAVGLLLYFQFWLLVNPEFKEVHSNFREIINQELDLAIVGDNQEFLFTHPKVNRDILYSPVLLIDFPVDQIPKRIGYDIKIHFELSRAGEVLDQGVFKVKSTDDKRKWGSLGFILADKYLVYSGDDNRYRLSLRVLENKVNLPRFESKVIVEMDNIALLNYFRILYPIMNFFRYFFALISIILVAFLYREKRSSR